MTQDNFIVEKTTEVTILEPVEKRPEEKLGSKVFSHLKYVSLGILLSSLVTGGFLYGLAKSPDYAEKIPLPVSTYLLTQRAKVIAFFAAGRPVALNFGVGPKVNCPLRVNFDYAVLAMKVVCADAGSTGIDLSFIQMEPSRRYEFDTVSKEELETPLTPPTPEASKTPVRPVSPVTKPEESTK